MEEKSLIQKLEQFLEDEARTCSVDFGCVTPLYVYRMWGGAVSLEKIEQVMSNIKMYDAKQRTNVRISYNTDKSVMELLV